MGADIDSACGQLITLENSNTKDEEAKGVRDIEDGLAGGSSSGTVSGTGRKGMVKKISLSSNTKIAASVDAASDRERFVDLESWIRPLQIATTVAATAFLVSSALYLRQQRKR